MKFISSGMNGEYLKSIHMASKEKTNSIKIAVAYASASPEILDFSYDEGVKISYWGRYDSTVPVTLPILKRFLDKKSPNYVFHGNP